MLAKLENVEITNLLRSLSGMICNYIVVNKGQWTRGLKWDERQKGKLKQGLQEKAAGAKDYAKKLLKDCKAWCGP